MSVVIRDGVTRGVKNLGWLLRHWRDVDHMGFTLEKKLHRQHIDGQLWAALNDGGTYRTDFACLTLCWRWLNRSILRGNPFLLEQSGKKYQETYIIGDERWRLVQKLADGGRDTYAAFWEDIGYPLPKRALRNLERARKNELSRNQ